MTETINQAVLFTKPVHHLSSAPAPEELDERLRAFFTDVGFTMVRSMPLTGPSLADREAIKEHYLMYSRAACVGTGEELKLSPEGQERFKTAFGQSWAAEASRVFGSPRLQQEKGITSHELYLLWNEQFGARKSCKLQDGVIVARLDELNCYCINAFYPAMEENFYHPSTRMTYHVVEVDPDRVSWSAFRKTILGATDCSKAAPESFRGRLYAEYKVEFPGRDNFVHGSAGPFEGLVERAIHEADFDMATNPVGRYLLGRGITLPIFRQWKAEQTIAQLGGLYDATEEKNTAEVIAHLDGVQFD